MAHPRQRGIGNSNLALGGGTRRPPTSKVGGVSASYLPAVGVVRLQTVRVWKFTSERSLSFAEGLGAFRQTRLWSDFKLAVVLEAPPHPHIEVRFPNSMSSASDSHALNDKGMGEMLLAQGLDAAP